MHIPCEEVDAPVPAHHIRKHHAAPGPRRRLCRRRVRRRRDVRAGPKIVHERRLIAIERLGHQRIPNEGHHKLSRDGSTQSNKEKEEGCSHV